MQQLLATGFKQLPVLHTGGTRLFTRAATQTTIDMFAERLRRIFQPSFSDGAHQVEASAWSIVLISGGHVCRTRFEAQPAMNTREQFLLLSSERRGETGVGCNLG